MKRTVIVTGALGGIGSSICKVFKEEGFYVVGIDKRTATRLDYYDELLEIDLSKFPNKKEYRQKCLTLLNSVMENLFVLINNAAVQLLDSFNQISLTDWQHTLDTNLTAPMLLSQWAVPSLERNSGSIINIASIHHQLTKQKFVSYATSKSALVGLTKAMAVDLSGRVRVNAISPGAIETDMLKAGFTGNELAFEELKGLHPSQRIGFPDEVARLALFLANDSGFINGANLTLDGGISSVLNDLRN
jgi:NAD(P)-dependent dehydrogenase (short-subunit alcohol dehydrogenase family)